MLRRVLRVSKYVPRLKIPSQIGNTDWNCNLGTCRTIYKEALPLLYSENWFYFSWPNDIEQFGHLELQTSPPECDKAQPLFGLQVEPYGRLAMLRRLVLQLSAPRSHIMHRQFMTDTNREDIWSHWLAFFHPVIEHGLCVGFPALDNLLLDFTDWQLGNDYTSQLRVRSRWLFSHCLFSPLRKSYFWNCYCLPLISAVVRTRTAIPHIPNLYQLNQPP